MALKFHDLGVLAPYTDFNEWSIESNTEGSCTIVDHSIQRSIATGTYDECRLYMKSGIA